MSDSNQKPNRIILIGFMGSGKSSTARCMAERLGIPVYDMDTLITERSGLSSVSEIFSERGESSFRDLETAIARELEGVESGIVSTGGGIISREVNRSILRAGGAIIVFLKTSFATVAQRVAGLSDRPLFKDRIKAEELFQSRAPIYEAWADIIIETDNLSPSQVCDQIILSLGRR